MRLIQYTTQISSSVTASPAQKNCAKAVLFIA